MFYGFKCFNSDLTNRYGVKYEVGKLYQALGEIKFGNDGNGFHVCSRLEDTLRYFDAFNDTVCIGMVRCYGEYDSQEDDYNGWYDLYCYQNMIIDHIMSRDEIIKYALGLYNERAKRFIALFKLTPEEIVLFKDKFKNNIDVLNYIEYYQEKNTYVFKRY